MGHNRVELDIAKRIQKRFRDLEQRIFGTAKTSHVDVRVGMQPIG